MVAFEWGMNALLKEWSSSFFLEWEAYGLGGDDMRHESPPTKEWSVEDVAIVLEGFLIQVHPFLRELHIPKIIVLLHQVE